MSEEEQDLNEEINEEEPDLEKNEEKNEVQQDSEEMEKEEDEEPDLESYNEENKIQQESEEIKEDEEDPVIERSEDESIVQQESEEIEEADEGPVIEKSEDESIVQQESAEMDQDEKDLIENQVEGTEEPELMEKSVEEEILADLEEIDKGIESLPSEPELLDEDGAKEEEIPTNIEDPDNEISGEEISQESIEEFMEQDESESTENSITSDELSAEELVSDEIDEHSRRKNIIEGALFVAGRPISIEELNIKTEIKKKDLEESLNELMMDYLLRATALEIVQIQDKFSLQIKPEYTPNVKKFATGGLIPDRHLKTLTIIALKQPILKSKLIKIRGSGAYEHVKFLLDRGFINAIKKGRSYELMTTENFADTFGLSRDVSTLKKQMINQLGINDTSNNDPSNEE